MVSKTFIDELWQALWRDDEEVSEASRGGVSLVLVARKSTPGVARSSTRYQPVTLLLHVVVSRVTLVSRVLLSATIFSEAAVKATSLSFSKYMSMRSCSFQCWNNIFCNNDFFPQNSDPIRWYWWEADPPRNSWIFFISCCNNFSYVSRFPGANQINFDCDIFSFVSTPEHNF